MNAPTLINCAVLLEEQSVPWGELRVACYEVYCQEGVCLNKKLWVAVFLIILVIVSLISAVAALEFRKFEFQRLNEELANTKQELVSLEEDYVSLQKNYSDQQYQVMAAFTPSLETRLGAKVLVDNKSGANFGKNYLWVTGEIYNGGYGIAFDAKLWVKIYVANSTQPFVEVKDLGDIAPTDFYSVRWYKHEDAKIERWEIEVTCSITR